MLFIRELFIAVLNMSIVATIMIIIIFAIRTLLMHRLDKKVLFALWCVLLFRLACPFSISTDFTFMNIVKNGEENNFVNMKYINDDLITVSRVEIISNEVDNKAINNDDNTKAKSILSNIWLFFILVIFTYNMVMHIIISSKLKLATRHKSKKIQEVKDILKIKTNIIVYETDQIVSPFVLGVIKPRVYVPVGIEGARLKYILLHEFVHIKRLDYILKPIFYIVSAIHWFNPFVWLAFRYMSRDIEIICDESVIKAIGRKYRQGYAHTLVSFATKKNKIIPTYNNCYGIIDLTIRVKNIINYENSSLRNKILSILIVIFIAINFAMNPCFKKHDDEYFVNDFKKTYSMSYINVNIEKHKPTYNCPVSSSRVTQKYCLDKEHHHNGIDIFSTIGESVKVIDSGRVIYFGKYGKYKSIMKIDHGNGYQSWYGGIDNRELQLNDYVSKGQIIGNIIYSGLGPHLHLSILYNGEFVDPTEYIKFDN
ncbi:M23/M56 family metallopeptidase [Clostridiaceae bacterium M8S5]|nr:M23/M56 family metallopeptidase [Clostridiaceae bacterium M8S5]